MGLDINTPKGQESVEQERKMVEYVEKSWGVKVFHTNIKDSSHIDGIIVKNKEIVGVCENKCRNLGLTEDNLLYDNKYDSYYDSWLITYNKIEIGRMVSKIFKVPFIGFLYLVDDDITLFWKITDYDGNLLFDFKIEEKPTQANVNGGISVRKNAYLPIEHSNVVVSIRKK